MIPFLYLIVDLFIVLAFIAGPWVILGKLHLQWPEWTADGIIPVIGAVIWAGIALYLATQSILLLGFVP